MLNREGKKIVRVPRIGNIFAKNRRLVSEVSDAYYILKKKPQINGAFFLPFIAKVALCFLFCK